MGIGAPRLAGTGKAHGGPYPADETAALRQAHDLWDERFHVPEDILSAWRTAGQRCVGEREAWEARLSSSDKASDFKRAIAGELPAGVSDAVIAHKKSVTEAGKSDATRKWSGAALEVLTGVVTDMVGGSADLTGSNNTKTSHTTAQGPNDWAGRYVHYGVREHGMAAAMNGMALHGGIIPYSGTFLAFADYSRAAIRLGALMGERVIHVMTHDSIGLGEDGPTHQPVEQISSLRAMPNIHVFRPCDGVETVEAWEVALNQTDTPSVLSLTRQGVPHARTTHTDDNLVAKGGYVLKDSDKPAQIVVVATGSEVGVALEAQDKLSEQGIAARVVSLPCMELFLQQPDAYQAEVLGGGLPKVGVEAGVRFGWDCVIGSDGGFVGMSGYGASAPYKDLFNHFNITAQAVVDEALKRV
jgi:transketolase